MADKIVIRDMHFYGYHGVFDSERELGQRFEVDVELHLDLRVIGRSDDLEMTVNYVDVYTIVKELVEEREFHLVEGLAEAIAEEILTAYDLERVVIRVRKPHAPIGGVTAGVEVEIEREGPHVRGAFESGLESADQDLIGDSDSD